MKVKNVLIYPCGTDEGLELNKALGQMIHYRLFGLGQHNTDQGEYIYLNYIGSLDPDQTNIIEQLSNIVNKFEIDFIYPASFEALLILSKFRVIDRAEVVAPSYETCAACCSKQAMTALLQEYVDVVDQSSGHAGSEYTAICLTDRHGTLKFIRPVEESSSIIRESDLDEQKVHLMHQMAQMIGDKLQLQGPWIFRFTVSDEENMLLIDVTPGFSTIMDFYRNKGVNLATLSLFDRMGHDIEIRDRELSIEATILPTKRYRIDYEYDDVYVDLDDTVLVNNRVNPLLIAFLYQCRNLGKKIHLITKHRHDLSETLEKHKIHALFDNIIWLKSFDQKSLHMKSERAIFIDDAFSERKQVSERLGIPTFEVSAVESLMDWRL
jgi:carbamoyl-phosphate synthase large subunit